MHGLGYELGSVVCEGQERLGMASGGLGVGHCFAFLAH